MYIYICLYIYILSLQLRQTWRKCADTIRVPNPTEEPTVLLLWPRPRLPILIIRSRTRSSPKCKQQTTSITLYLQKFYYTHTQKGGNFFFVIFFLISLTPPPIVSLMIAFHTLSTPANNIIFLAPAPISFFYALAWLERLAKHLFFALLIFW